MLKRFYRAALSRLSTDNKQTCPTHVIRMSCCQTLMTEITAILLGLLFLQHKLFLQKSRGILQHKLLLHHRLLLKHRLLSAPA